MGIKKRALSLLTAAGLLVSAVPMSALTPIVITASAADSDSVNEAPPVASVVSEDLSLDSDMTVNGSLEFKSGRINLNGYKLTVNGNFYHSGGVLEMGSGSVKVTGNYEMQEKGGYFGSGELRIYKEESSLDVDGDVIINTSVEKSPSQYNGKLIIGGNLTVKSPYSGIGYMPSSSHVTEFKGNTTHTVDFANTDNYLNKVSVTDGGQLLLTGATTGFSLESDAAFADGSVIKGERTLYLKNHTLTVNGDFTQAGSLIIDCGGGTLDVRGSFYHPGGVLDMGTGSITVGGNYEMQEKGGYFGTGELRIYKEESSLDVDGDVIINSNVVKSASQYNGKLIIGGNLTVKAPFSGKGYYPSGSHITQFKGKTTHTVHFANTDNYLHRVSVTDGGQLLLTGATTGFSLESDAALADGSVIKGERTLYLRDHTLTVNGDFSQEGPLTIDCGEGTLDVRGSYYQPKGILEVHSGSVKVGGNYEMQEKGGYFGTGELRIYNAGTSVDVDGDVIINSSVAKSNSQYNGNLIIGGNLTVKSPFNGCGYMPYEAHVTVFKGDEIHTVNFTSGNNKLSRVAVTGNGQLFITGETSGFKLDSDAVFADKSCIKGGKTLELNGHTLTVDGDFTQNGSLAVNVGSGIMQVSGNYYQPCGILDVSAGTVKVGKNYEIQNEGGYFGSGELRMYHANALLDIDGDMIVNSSIEKSNAQYNGKVVIGGNLTVKSPFSGRGYMPTASHITEFKGGKAHEINLASTDVNTGSLKLGIGDSIEFTNSLNGVSGGSNAEIKLSSDIASVSGLSVKGVKKGKCDIDFINDKNSVGKKLEVGEINNDVYTPEITKPAEFYMLNLDDNAMLLYGVGNGKLYKHSSLGGLVIGGSDTKEAGGITFKGCNELTYAVAQGSVEKLTDLSFVDCRSLMKLVIVNPECDLSGLSLSGFNGTIYGNSGSAAEAYAKEHGFKFSNTGSDVDDGKKYAGDVILSLGEAVSAEQGGTVYLPIYMDTKGLPMYGSNICVNPGGEYLISDEYLAPEDCGFENGLTLREDGGYDVDPDKPVRIYKMVIGSTAAQGIYTAAVQSIWSGGAEPEVLAKSGDAEGGLPEFFKPSVKSVEIKVDKAAETTAPATTASTNTETADNSTGTTITVSVTGTEKPITGTGAETGGTTVTVPVTSGSDGTNGTSAETDASNVNTNTNANTNTNINTNINTGTGAGTTAAVSTGPLETHEVHVYSDIFYFVETIKGGGETVAVVSAYDVAYGTDVLSIPAEINSIPVGGIGDKAFENSTFTTVTIPDNIKTIGDAPFFNNRKLQEISVSEENENFTCENGVLYTKDKSTLIQYPGGSDKQSYTVSKEAEKIGNGAFFGNNYIKEIDIQDGVKAIGDNSFGECGKLKNVDIPASVEVIGDKAFASCGALNRITIISDDCRIVGDGSTISGEDGKFSGTIFAPKDSPAQEYAEKYGYNFVAIDKDFLRGDISRNKKIDLKDAILIAKFMVGTVKFSDADKNIADFNNDGKANLQDAIGIANTIYYLRYIQKEAKVV